MPSSRFVRRVAVTAVAVLSGAVFSVSAWAHAHLQQSVPAADAEVAAPQRIELHFNEKLIERFAKVSVVALEPGNNGPADKAPGKPVDGVTISLGADGQAVLATPAQPLPAGRYRVEWRVVSADTHPVKGQFVFTVK